MDEDDNQQALMNSEDEKLFGDEDSVLPDAPPTEEKKKDLKRKRDAEKEEEKEKGEAETPAASDRLRATFNDSVRKKTKKIKKKNERSNSVSSDADDVDTFLQGEVEKEMRLDLGIDSSDDDDSDENAKESDDEPPAKKRRLIKKKGKSALTLPDAPTSSKSPERQSLLSNLDALINDDDLDFDDAASTTAAKPKKTNSDDMGVTTTLNMDKASEDATARPKAPMRLMAHNGWPIQAGSNEVFTIRCTYAEHGKGPFQLLEASEGLASADLTRVRTTPWGVFAHHGYRPEREKKDKNDDNAIAFDEEDSKSGGGGADTTGGDKADTFGINDDELIDADNEGNVGRYGQQKKPDSERPWMILVGDLSILRPLASPLFMHRVRVVRVNPDQVIFNYKRAAPIYYVYEILEKRALWSIKGAHQAWTPIQLSRILVDTLYSHLELYTEANHSSQLEHVLSGIKCFPLHSDPANKMLPPDHVPLNDYSNRKDRSTELRNKLTSRVKTRDKAVATLDGNPVMHCRDLMQCTLRLRDLLFEDLEKPASAWTLLNRGVPYGAINKLTNWTARDPEMVKKRFAATRTLYSKDIGEVNFSQLEHLGTLMELDPAWFADWFANLENNKLKELFSTPEALQERTKELRLEMYGIFCASSFLHAYQEKRTRFGANYHYIFSKETCDQFFGRGWLHVSDYARLNRRLANEPEAEGAALDDDEEAMLRVHTHDHLKAMNNSVGADAEKTKSAGDAGLQSVDQKAARPILVSAGLGTSVLVHPSVVKRAQSMAKLLMEVGMRWASYCREGHLTGPLATLPPLTIQSAYLYGPTTVVKLDSMYTRLLQTVKASSLATFVGKDPAKLRAIVIRADDDPSAIFGILRHNMSTLCMIIMDRFHVWSETLIDTVLDVLTSGPSHSQCTHLFITAHSHSFSDMNTSGLMFEDLVDTARRFKTLVGLSTTEDDSGNFWQTSDSRFLKSIAPGDISSQLYTTAQRDDQLALNQAIVKEEYTFMSAISKFAAVTPPASVAIPSINLVGTNNKGNAIHQEMVAASIPRPSILILFALKRTEADIKKFLAEDSGAWGLNAVTMVNYETLSRYPSQTAGDRACVMLFDLEYSGAGHATFLHVNAAFERCKGEVLVFRASDLRNTHAPDKVTAATARTTANAARSAFSAIKKMFMVSDSKTDRLATRNQRLSLLKKELERYFGNAKLMSLFKTTHD